MKSKVEEKYLHRYIEMFCYYELLYIEIQLIVIHVIFQYPSLVKVEIKAAAVIWSGYGDNINTLKLFIITGISAQ